MRAAMLGSGASAAAMLSIPQILQPLSGTRVRARSTMRAIERSGNCVRTIRPPNSLETLGSTI
jgi:hypothetical protein